MTYDEKEEYSERDPAHFNNLPEWPEFDIYDKTVDGLIPACKISSWEQVDAIAKHYRPDKDDQSCDYVFRDHHHHKWFLTPTLSRKLGGSIPSDVAEKQLKRFKLATRGRLSDTSILQDDDMEVWAIGQHHGLDTPLLDWTSAPYVALFFAFEKEDPEDWVDSLGKPNNHSRAIFILNRTFIEDLKDSQTVLQIVEPAKDDHGRLVNQAGLFTIAPLDETLESSLLNSLSDSGVDISDPAEVARYVCKVHVPNSEKIRLEILLHLRRMNIHYASIFPDIIGASLYCNQLTDEDVTGRPQTKSTKQSIAKDPQPTFADDDDADTDLQDSLVPGDILPAFHLSGGIPDAVNESQLLDLIRGSINYIMDNAGVDWTKFDTQKARFRLKITRDLKRIHYPEDQAKDAATRFVDHVAKITDEQNQQ